MFGSDQEKKKETQWIGVSHHLLTPHVQWNFWLEINALSLNSIPEEIPFRKLIWDGNFCEPAIKALMGGHLPLTRAVFALLARILRWQACVLRAQLVAPSLLHHLVAPLPQTATTTLVRRVRIEPGSLRNRWNVHLSLRLSAKCTLSYFLQFWF